MLSCHGSRRWKSSSSTPLGKDFLSDDIWPKSEVISFSFEGWVSPVFSQNPEQGILPRFFQHGTKNPKTSKLDGICKPLWTWPASNQSPLSPWKIMESPLRTTQLWNSSRFIKIHQCRKIIINHLSGEYTSSCESYHPTICRSWALNWSCLAVRWSRSLRLDCKRLGSVNYKVGN